MTYNLDTLLAEKLETMIARGTANTRMRDFYDVFLLTRDKQVDLSALREAIFNTSRRRGREMLLENRGNVMKDIAESPIMEAAWNNFKRQSYFVGGLSWREVIEGCQLLIEYVLPE